MLKKYVMCSVAALALVGGAVAQGPVELDDEIGPSILDELFLPEVAVAGLRPILVGSEAVSVTVLDETDLAVRLSPNPADQLRAVPGVGVSGSGGAGALTQVRIRGAEANHTLVLVDGIEVSDPVTGETDFGLLTGIGAYRVEVLRGEGSSIYGSDAIGGVVSMSTDEARGLAGMVEGGTFDTYRGALSVSGDVGDGRTSVGAALSAYRTGGVDTSGRGGETDGAEAYSAAVRAGHYFMNGWRVNGLAIARQSTVETDPDLDFDGVLDNADRDTEAEQFLIGASASGELVGLNHEFRLSFNTVERENTADGAIADTAEGDRLKASWSPSLELSAGTVTGLLDWEKETYDRADVSFGGFTNASEEFETVGLAGEYRLDRDVWNLVASVRQDFNDGRFDDATTFRVGGAYRFEGLDGRVRASVGTGVKNPTFTELFGFFPGSFVGNADLVPEKSLGYELGWDQTLGRAVVSATLFRSELEDEIFTAFNADFTSTAQNREGESVREGIELGLSWAASERLSISGQVTALTSENDSDADEVRVPERTASLGVNWQPAPDSYRLGAAIDYVGGQDDFDFGAFPARRVNLDAYTLVSGSAEIPVTDLIALTFRVENGLNEDATDVFGFNKPGAAAFVGLKLR